MVAFNLFYSRRLPKTPTDWFAFLFLVGGVHAVLLFELFYVLPFLYDKGFHDSVFMYYFHIVAAFFIYFNVLSNTYMVMTTETGLRGLMLPNVLNPGWRFCSVCECNAPPRSYHCHICRTCVLKRDHHCVFTGCCIGHTNQRYFVLMIFYFWIAAVYATIMNWDLIYHIFGEYSLKTAFVLIVPLLAWMFRVVETVTMSMAFMISLCLIVSLLSTAMLGYHLMNIFKGQTVFEKTHRIHVYNAGLLNNVKAVFGEKWSVCWICPWIWSPPVGDGLVFTQQETPKDL